MAMLSANEMKRYQRQLRLDQWTEEAQKKLLDTRVLVVGAGALGCPVIQYLTGAGVGKIGIVDDDLVELSNLHRQVLYKEQDLGRRKTEVAAEIVHQMNSEIDVQVFNLRLTSDNIHELAQNFDILVDGTDNFPTRYLVNDYCVLNEKVNVHGSIQQFSGQVSVFNALHQDGNRGTNYRDLFPEPPNPEEVVTCAEGGVIGALPGIIGTYMAMEVIKLASGVGDVLSGNLLTIDTLTNNIQNFKFRKRKDNPLTGDNPTQKELIDYVAFCAGNKKEETMKEIDVQELKRMMDAKEDFALIDVREEFEYAQANMGAELIPLQQVPERMDEIPKDKPVVVHCKMGGRSANAIMFLQQHGYSNLMNLKGGITAWAQQIDPSLNV